MRRLQLQLIAVLAFVACESPFIPQHVITRPRILAIRADRPESTPGQTVRLDALIVDPGESAPGYRWFACDPSPNEGLLPCEDTRVLSSVAALETTEGVRVLGTSSVATYTSDPALDTSRPRRALVLLVATVGPDRLVGSKSLIVSRAAEPDVNPELEVIVAAARQRGPEDLVVAERGATIEWSAIVTSTSAQLYSRTRPDGEVVTATEDLRIAWYTEHGRFGLGPRTETPGKIRDFLIDSGLPPPRDAAPEEGGGESSVDEFGFKVTLEVPEADEDQVPRPPEARPFRVWVVVIDGRGGTTWAERRVSLRDTDR